MTVKGLISTVLTLLLAASFSPLWGAGFLAPGDSLMVSVLGEPTLTGKVVINPEGRVALPMVGEVEAAGRAPADLVTEITAKLGEYLKNPQVTVDLLERAQLKVAISGEVQKSGIFFLPAGSKLSEALAAAGGLTDLADAEAVQLVRVAGTTSHSLPELATPQGMLTDPQLESGDAIVVPRITPEKGYQVLGCVARPGLYALHGATGVWEAVTRAGGLSEKADAEHAIVARKSGERVPVNLNKMLTIEGMSQRLLVEPGDVVNVPSLASQVFVMGAVNRPGALLLRQGAPLLEVLASVGGLTPRAKAKDAYVLRGTEGGTAAGTRLPVDLNRLLAKADLSLNMALQDGDILVVPEEMGAPKRGFLEKVGPLMPLLYLVM